MKALIDVSKIEVNKGCEITFNIPVKYCDESGAFDMNKLDDCDTFINVKRSQSCNVKFVILSNGGNEPSIEVKHTSILSKSTIEANVEVIKTRNHGVFGWLGYMIVNILKR